jgi:tripartite-type tricarboxylate transporter receptor subunit TctC
MFPRRLRLDRRVVATATAFILTIGSGVALPADYPTHPVKVITQGAAGSGPHVVARIVADHLARAWGTAVPIVNQTGGGGLIAAQTAAVAEPDGHTLYLPTITSFVILPEMHDKLPVDLHRQFVPIGIVAELPMVVAVAPGLGINTLADLITRAKEKPGELFYAANNRGSLPHLTGELLRRSSGIDMSFVPYPGATAGLRDLVGGRVSVIVESVGALAGAIKGGTVKPIAVASAQRLQSLPDVPTVAETTPGFTAVGWLSLMAPANTPPAIVGKVSADLQAVLRDRDLRARLEELGAVARPTTSEETAAFIRSEEQRWRPVVRQLGLKTQ